VIEKTHGEDEPSPAGGKELPCRVDLVTHPPRNEGTGKGHLKGSQGNLLSLGRKKEAQGTQTQKKSFEGEMIGAYLKKKCGVKPGHHGFSKMRDNSKVREHANPFFWSLGEGGTARGRRGP